MAQRVLILILIIALALGNIFLFVRLMSTQDQLAAKETVLINQSINERALNFANLFIDKVLQAKGGEVSLDDRLALENSVRALGDQQIFNTWNDFVNSKTELDAQDAVKNLLSLLVRKVRTQ